MEQVHEIRNGLFTLTDNANYKCVTKHGARWVGGVYDINRGQFCNGRESARGMNPESLRLAYSLTFKTKREALAWLRE